MQKLEDTSPMPYGDYKGRAMEDVPAAYLLWLVDNQRASPEVIEYVRENQDVLDKEIKENAKPDF